MARTPTLGRQVAGRGRSNLGIFRGRILAAGVGSQSLESKLLFLFVNPMLLFFVN
jgi:hypothetical protein